MGSSSLDPADRLAADGLTGSDARGPRQPSDLRPAGEATPPPGLYLETVIFYTLSAGALMLLSDLLAPLLRVSPMAGFLAKPVAAYACAFAAARSGQGSPALAGFSVGLVSAILYEIAAVSASRMTQIMPFATAAEFRLYLLAVIAIGALAGTTAGLLAATLRRQ